MNAARYVAGRGMQGWQDRDAEMRRCRDTEVQRCRGAEMQRCRDAEVQR